MYFHVFLCIFIYLVYVFLYLFIHFRVSLCICVFSCIFQYSLYSLYSLCGVYYWSYLNLAKSAALKDRNSVKVKDQIETRALDILPPSDWIRYVITKWIYPYPYPVVITSLVADQVDTDPNLWYACILYAVGGAVANIAVSSLHHIPHMVPWAHVRYMV